MLDPGRPEAGRADRAAPANGSTTRGRVPGAPPSDSWAACVSARLASRYSATVKLSQLAKSAMKSSRREPELVEMGRVGRVERQALLRSQDDPLPLAERFDRRRGMERRLVVDRLGKPRQDARRRVAKTLRAERVGRVRPERGADHRPAGRQGPTSPPDVQRRDVPVPDRLLASRMGADPPDGQVHLDQSSGVGGRWLIRTSRPRSIRLAEGIVAHGRSIVHHFDLRHESAGSDGQMISTPEV